MKKILFISVFFLFSCSNQNKILKFRVDCENNIFLNDKILNLNEINKIVEGHRLKYNSEAGFKIEVCQETSVKVLVELRKVIKSK